MPRPATHLQSVQATVKMANASDLSLRGGRRPTWQSRSTRPHRGKAIGENATAFPRLPRRFAPRNDTSGEREVHQRPPTVELLPTGRSLSAATGPVGAVTILTAACANRLCSAGRGMPLPATHLQSVQATVKMANAFDLSLRGGRRPTWQSRSTRPHRGKAIGENATAFPRLPRRFAPRNDTSGEREVHQRPPTVELLPTGRSLSAATGPVGAVTILTAACANRLCSTGPGCPLPYKARPEACLLFILHFSVFSIHFFTYAPPATACAWFA